MAFSQNYINKHALIFRGKTLAVSPGTDYDRVTFLVAKLFKGSGPKEMTVYYEKKDSCRLKFNVGEDWLLYATYKQLTKPYVAYCSRSRKNVIITNKNVDIQYIKNDLTVNEECEKLQNLCGLQNFTAQLADPSNAHNNIIPSFGQRIMLIVFSILGFMLVLFVLSRVLKK